MLMRGRLEKLNVTNLVRLSRPALASSLRREIIKLNEMGFFSLKPNPIDSRIRDIIPTPKFKKLQQKFEAAFTQSIDN